MADDYIAALELERDNATLMANDMARRIRVMDTQNNGDPDLINGTAQDRIQMQAVVQIYTDRMDNLNAKIARAHQIRQANAPTIQMPPDLPAAPAGQGQQGHQGHQNQAQWAPLVPGVANPNPNIMEAVKHCRQYDQGPKDYRSIFQKLADIAVEKQFSHATMRRVLNGVLTGTDLETFRHMQHRTMQQVADYFLAMCPPTLDPSGAKSQLATFQRLPNESCLAAINRYELLYSIAAPIMPFNQNQGLNAQGLTEPQKVTQLMQLLGPKSRQDVENQQNELLRFRNQTMDYATTLRWAQHYETANREYDPVAGFTPRGVDTLGLHHLSINNVNYPEVQTTGMKGVFERARGRTNAYRASPSDLMRADRAQERTRQRSASREALIDQRRAASIEKMDTTEPARPHPAIPQPQYVEPPPSPAPRPPPSAEPPRRYQEPAPYPEKLDYNSKYHDAMANQTPRRSRRDVWTDRQDYPRPYGDRQRPRSRGSSAEPQRFQSPAPAERDTRPPPVGKNWERRDFTPDRRSGSYDRNRAYQDNRNSNYRDGDRRPRDGRSTSVNRQQDNRRRDSAGPKRALSGVRDVAIPGDTLMSNVVTHSGQHYPKYRVRGTHVPENFDFERQPEYCTKCPGTKDSRTGRIIRETNHTAFNCPLYLFISRTPCRVCDALGLTGYHHTRDCMNDSRNGTPLN